MTNLSRLEDRADLQISIVLLASWVAILVSANWGNWPPDLSALYMAGHFWSTGQYDLIYASPEKFFGVGVQSWADELTRLGYPDEVFFPYIYPPLWAALASPLAQALSPPAFFNLFYVIHISMIAASIFLTYRLIKPPVPLALWCVVSCFLAYLSMLSSTALFHNQLQITVTFLIILSLERYGASAMSEQVVIMRVNWNLESFLFQVSSLITGVPLIDPAKLPAELLASPLDHTQPEPFWITIFTKVVLIAAIALVLFRTHGLNRLDRLRLRPIGLLLAMTMCAPLGWSHHYLPVLMLLPVILTFVAPLRAIALLLAFASVTSIGVFELVHLQNTQIHFNAMFNTAILMATFALFFARPKSFISKQPSKMLKRRRLSPK